MASTITTSVSDDEDRPDWFSLSVRVHVGQEEIPLALLMAADPTIRGYSIMIQHVVVNSEYHYVSL